MPTTGIGVYGAALVENDEVSSTHEGRHLTFYETDITGKEDTYIVKGHPCVVGDHIVGVAFATGTVANELIAIDTEGIWALYVVAEDDLGDIAVAAGDALWINKSNAQISKKRNTNTHTPFGYALGSIVAGDEDAIAVKVHWDGDDEQEQVGLTGTPFESAEVSRVFRSYFYESTGGSYIRGEDFELTIPSDSARVFEAIGKRIELTIPGDAWVCTGMVTPLDIGLVVTAGDVNMGTWGVLTLRFDCENTMGNTNHADAYIHLRDAHEDLYNTQAMAALLSFYDHDALDDGGVTLGYSILQDSQTDHASDVRIACEYGAGNNRFWLMGTTTAPD